MHWGFENNTLPMPYDIQLAHECIDNGSDLVIGSHPHVTQPFEKYKGKYIFYSLGNFYFAERRKRYKRQFSNEVFTNMNDYGMGVVYDIKNRNTLIDESVVLEYRHDLDRTIISNCHEILRDISDIDWNSKQYKEEVINHKNNINPVLGTNANVNTLCLFGLSIVHGLSKRSQFIKKSKLGGVIFSK